MSKYENLSFKCIKGKKLDEISTRTLREIGFPVDAPAEPVCYSEKIWHSYMNKIYNTHYSVIGTVEKKYISNLIEFQDRERAVDAVLSELEELGVTSEELIEDLKKCRLYDFSPSEAEQMIDEFVYLIENLLPRKLSDIYYCFDIQPNPAYHIFFDFAVKKLGIETNDDPNSTRFGNFIGYQDIGVKEKLIAGVSLQDIYLQTCASKQLIKELVSQFNYDEIKRIGTKPEKLILERILFGLSPQYTYRKNFNICGKAFDFVLFFGEEPQLAIDYVNFYFDLGTNYFQSSGKEWGIPYLKIDFYEIEGYSALRVIKKALNDPSYAELHNKEREYDFLCEYAYDHGISDRETVENSKFCGCFSCGKIFCAEEIKEFSYNDIAICPFCEEKTVLSDYSGFDITPEFLDRVGEIADDLY